MSNGRYSDAASYRFNISHSVSVPFEKSLLFSHKKCIGTSSTVLHYSVCSFFFKKLLHAVVRIKCP